jgi:putative tricarboxylic transport membrane protein
MLDLFLGGFVSISTVAGLSMILIGVVVGIIFGMIPGLTTTMCVALCLPLTFGMDPIVAMCLLMGIYVGGVSGGLISAILIGIPGTPASVATCFDGYPMTKKGEAGKALGVGIFWSFLGTLLSIVALIFISPPLADFALRFGPIEYCAIAVFSLTMIGSLAGEYLSKGIAVGLIGMVLAFVGVAPIDAMPRFTFGWHELDNGFDILPALIGLFAVAEIIKAAETDLNVKQPELKMNFHIRGLGFSLKEFIGQWYNTIRSAIIGIIIGILPGIGSGTSNMLSYGVAKSQSKDPSRYGTGIIDGIVASETASCSAIGGAIVPLLTLGIPGDTVTAMLLGGLMVHGLTPGPLLFVKSANVVYGIFAALIVANFVMLALEYGGIRVFTKLLKVPRHILLPIILVLCVVGAYGLNNRVFDVWVILFFGVLGYAFTKFRFPMAPIILGIILGPMAETGLRRGLQMTNGDFIPFLTQPIAAFFWVAAVFTMVYTGFSHYRKQKKKAVAVKG